MTFPEFVQSTREKEYIIPLEVDENDQVGGLKGEKFLDEYETDDADKDELSFINLISTSNNNRSTRVSCKTHLGKSHIAMMILVAASLFSGTVVFWKKRNPILRFRLEDHPSYGSDSQYPSSNLTFKIMQITDIHLGEAENTEWGPRQDEKTFALLEKMFLFEPDCDLLVLGGDQLTANNCLGNCTKYYKMLGTFLSEYGIPWATIMGNHDDMDFEIEDGSGKTIPHSYSRRDLLRVDQRFPLSLSKASTKGETTGVTNYILDVLDPVDEQPAFQIFFLDSGGGSLREAITDDQILWLRQQLADEKLLRIPAVAFQHIPTWQHEYVDGNCVGYQGEGVAELEYDGGVVDVMVESGRFHFLAVGHNHGNDYCCSYNTNEQQAENVHDLYFCFGRHSGYGGYGKWDRGVRMYEISLPITYAESDDRFGELGREVNWRTWVRLESGEKVHALDFDHRNRTLATKGQERQNDFV